MYGRTVTVNHRNGSTTGTVSLGAREAGPAYYYVYDSSNAGCSGTSTDNNCYDIRFVNASSGVGGTDERQNFANWFSFYRTRNLMTVSSAALAFTSVPETTRVAWQALNSCRGSTSALVTADCEGWETTATNFSNAIKPFAGTQKSNFYYWLSRLKTRTSTPLRQAMARAGSYFSSSGNNSPYDNDLSTTDATEYSCRKNFHLMMTDGIWNDSVSGYGNYDSASHTLPDGTAYTSRRPYLDSNSDSVADIAFYYWANDLRTGLDNTVPGYFSDYSSSGTAQYFNAKNDPASWQHMVNFTVGLGLTAFLANTGLTWGGDTFSGSYTNILAGTQNWPTASSGVDGNVADLWHAAVNSRGKFYNASDPQALVAAFQDIVDTVSSRASAGGGAGLSSNTTQINQQDATVYRAKFNADWSGLLEALPVHTDGSFGTAYWDAGQLLPTPSERNIFTTNGGAVEDFTTCTTGSPLATALNADATGTVDNLCAKRLNWLRGDAKITAAAWDTNTDTLTFTATGHGFEVGDVVVVSGVTTSTVTNTFNGTYTITAATADTFSVAKASSPGTYASGGKGQYDIFRKRSSVLGDIINSDPAYSKAEDFGYGGGSVTLNGHSSYQSYVTTKSNRAPVIAVGANDGMLHVFNAETGAEFFAYVPAGVYDNLSTLTSPGYSHKFFVDGSPSVGDAYIGGGWKTYVLGSLGAGGRSIFALDITSPGTFSTGDVKWEFSDAADLGLTYSTPEIAAVDNSTWAAVFGNGYNSTNGCAILYVVQLDNVASASKISTGICGNNGLSTPYLLDSDGDKVMDTAYAGDLQGNLWKFVNSSGSWSVGNGGDPLFTARNVNNDVQPITSKPKVANHPNGGHLVYFGTGSYLGSADLANDDVQSFYAIWDKPSTTGTVARTDLQQQTILNTLNAFGYTVRTTSKNTPNWGSQRGWFMDLPATAGSASERIISTPLVLEFVSPSVPDRVLFVTNTPNSDPCSVGGTTWLMELDLITGSRTSVSVFDLNSDNLSPDNPFDVNDTVDQQDTNGDGTISDEEKIPASGMALPSQYGITAEPLLLHNPDTGKIVKEFTGSTGVSGAPTADQSGEPPPLAGAPTRIYWQQIL